MLNSETKRRIDACRDVLVGKLPQPSNQVELITLALIYKFMDDLDEESVKLGGKRSFFTGELAKYRWRNLLPQTVAADERVTLFSEGVEALGHPKKAAHLPGLFRDIFRNAFLKFRDGRILTMFLTEVNGFAYSHSEELGNAFEYLLQCTGAQGENGQFRTPRHIIDFIVACLDPQPGDKILDPACGTGGFLVSAFKHILATHTSAAASSLSSARSGGEGWGEEVLMTGRGDSSVQRASSPRPSPPSDGGEGVRRTGEEAAAVSSLSPARSGGEGRGEEGRSIIPGDLLTFAQRQQVYKNLAGYDVDDQMVKLSKVNLFLHGFPDPAIHIYDTLSNDARWHEKADLILANPPFMTPKGGVTPHTKFRIATKKAEVLFTDHIAEHLSGDGRGGVIVPNGIVATTQNAYVKLRRFLVEDSLVAVVSLPAGVFKPYSGVKTSILLLDKKLARTAKEILFLKITADGFDLGDKRNPIEANDLPEAERMVRLWFSGKLKEGAESVVAWKAVEKKTLLDDGDSVLSVERFLGGEKVEQLVPHVAIGELCDIINGSTPLRSEARFWENGDVAWFTIDDVRDQGREIWRTKQNITQAALRETSSKVLPANTVLLCCTASVGEFAIARIPLCTNQQFNGLVIKKDAEDKLLPDYLFAIASRFKPELIRLSGQTTFNFVSGKTLKGIEIPLPPLEEQRRIVAEIEGYQNEIARLESEIAANRERIQTTIDAVWKGESA